jgi:phosphate:Na+ symporter
VTGALTFLNLAGAVALLLWGMHMVQSGVQRALGGEFRRILSRGLADGFKLSPRALASRRSFRAAPRPPS